MGKRNQADIRFLDLPGITNARAVCASDVTNAFPRHVHDTFCIGIVTKGTRIICLQKKTIPVLKDNLFLINPGVAHTCRSGDKTGHSYGVICVSSDFMKQIASQIAEKPQPVPYFTNPVVTDKDLVDSLKQFFFLIDRPVSTIEKESVLMNLLSGLILRHGDDPPAPCKTGSHHAETSRVCEYIHKHHAENLSLKQLAQTACLSPFHFQRIFLASKGVSPHEYLLRVRIDESVKLLRKGYSIIDVALAAGFVDQSHFSRNFKRIMGIPHGRYSKTNNNTKTFLKCCAKFYKFAIMPYGLYVYVQKPM